jgi:hypothetical protein
LSAVVGYLDYVLISAMLLFVAITVCAVLKHRKRA